MISPQAPGLGAEPGADEIVLTAPASGTLCNSLTCKRQRKRADVVVTFGRLAALWFDPGALWPECSGHSHPDCAACWDRTHQVARDRRPGLLVRDCRPAAPTGPPAGNRSQM